MTPLMARLAEEHTGYSSDENVKGYGLKTAALKFPAPTPDRAQHPLIQPSPGALEAAARLTEINARDTEQHKTSNAITEHKHGKGVGAPLMETTREIHDQLDDLLIFILTVYLPLNNLLM